MKWTRDNGQSIRNQQMNKGFYLLLFQHLSARWAFPLFSEEISRIELKYPSSPLKCLFDFFQPLGFFSKFYNKMQANRKFKHTTDKFIAVDLSTCLTRKRRVDTRYWITTQHIHRWKCVLPLAQQSMLLLCKFSFLSISSLPKALLYIFCHTYLSIRSLALSTISSHLSSQSSTSFLKALFCSAEKAESLHSLCAASVASVNLGS